MNIQDLQAGLLAKLMTENVYLPKGQTPYIKVTLVEAKEKLFPCEGFSFYLVMPRFPAIVDANALVLELEATELTTLVIKAKGAPVRTNKGYAFSLMLSESKTLFVAAVADREDSAPACNYALRMIHEIG